MSTEDWDNLVSFQADPAFNLTQTIVARARVNSTRAPDGVVDHPPTEPPELEPPYSPFGSPLSSLPPSDASSPLSSPPPSPPISSPPPLNPLPELEVSRGKKRRRRKKQSSANLTTLPSPAPSIPPSSSPSPLPSVSVSPIPSTSASPLPSTSPLPSEPSLSVSSAPRNPETARKHRLRQKKRQKLKDQTSATLGGKLVQHSTAVGTGFDTAAILNETD
ncbi:hypothetical protein VNI00_018941, partial [Paramarasmius palmivorus]